MARSKSLSRRGYTLVELLVILGIIGALVGLLMPAVQSARESARRASCQNNLKNIGLALSSFLSVRRTFPIGCELASGTQHAWSSRILPFLEESALARGINYQQPWNSPGANLAAADQDLPCYVCPSALLSSPGKQDYGGIMGTALLLLKPGMGPQQAFGCGVLITSNALQTSAVTPARITDGLSQTLCVGESSDRADASASRWACGLNCFSQNEPRVDMDDVGSLHSEHPIGAHGLFADGHVQLIDDSIDAAVLGSLCTRNGNEIATSGEVSVSDAFLP